MRCDKCGEQFEEKELQESHDIPCYLFIYAGNRKGQKNQADNYGRHWLCKPCHDLYEQTLNNFLKLHALRFAEGWFI